MAEIWETVIERKEEYARIPQWKQDYTQPRNSGLCYCSKKLTATRNFSLIEQTCRAVKS